MKKTSLYLSFVVILLSFFSVSARADTAADMLRDYSEKGQFEEGIIALTPLADKDDAEALAARGTLQFFLTLNHAAQSLTKYGFHPPSRSFRFFGLESFETPTQANNAVEPITYIKFRDILLQFTSDLEKSHADLSKVAGREVRLSLNVFNIRFDLTGERKLEKMATLRQILAVPPSIDLQQGQFTFDTTDVYWLEAYTRLLSVPADFSLSFDFEESYNKTFQIFFPNTDSEFARYLAAHPDDEAHAGRTDPYNFADVISFIHLIHWNVIEPDRLKLVRDHLLEVADLNEKVWASARAETDNDHEWLPNAKQTGIMPVTDEIIDEWLGGMKLLRATLNGELLMPHWRFQQGLNIKRMMLEMKRFDLVLLSTGADAYPWLEQGPIISQEQIGKSQLDKDFWLYSLWFN